MATQIVGVTGARGGVGASVLAAALARRAAGSGRRTVLVDLGRGGGLDVLLGLEHEPGPRWPDADLPGGASVSVLPEWAGVGVLSADRSRRRPRPAGVMEVVDGLARACDVVILDLGCVSDDDDGGFVRTCSTILVATTRDVRATAGVLAQRAVLATACADVRLVVRGPAPGGLGVLELAHVVDLPVAASGRADRGLDSALERGFGPPPSGPLARLAARVWRDL